MIPKLAEIEKSSDYGEVIEYDEIVMVVHNARTDDVDVTYVSSTGTVVIEYDGKAFEYNTGCIENVEAKVNNGVITITGRRCENGDNGDSDEDIQEE